MSRRGTGLGVPRPRISKEDGLNLLLQMLPKKYHVQITEAVEENTLLDFPQNVEEYFEYTFNDDSKEALKNDLMEFLGVETLRFTKSRDKLMPLFEKALRAFMIQKQTRKKKKDVMREVIFSPPYGVEYVKALTQFNELSKARGHNYSISKKTSPK